MDALPVTERVDVPFKSVAKSNYRGEEVGVMHACGHDSHIAVLMGVAETLTRMKGELQRQRAVRVPARRRRCTAGRGGRRVADAQGKASSRSTSPKSRSAGMRGRACVPAKSAIARVLSSPDSNAWRMRGHRPAGARFRAVERRGPHRGVGADRQCDADGDQPAAGPRPRFPRCSRWASSRAACATTSSPTRWS